MICLRVQSMSSGTPKYWAPGRSRGSQVVSTARPSSPTTHAWWIANGSVGVIA